MHRRERDTAPPADDVADFFASAAPSGSDRDDGYGPWFDASFPGECAGCWDAVDPGDRIRTDGEGGYLCEDCGDE